MKLMRNLFHSISQIINTHRWAHHLMIIFSSTWLWCSPFKSVLSALIIIKVHNWITHIRLISHWFMSALWYDFHPIQNVREWSQLTTEFILWLILLWPIWVILGPWPLIGDGFDPMPYVSKYDLWSWVYNLDSSNASPLWCCPYWHPYAFIF